MALCVKAERMAWAESTASCRSGLYTEGGRGRAQIYTKNCFIFLEKKHIYTSKNLIYNYIIKLTFLDWLKVSWFA